MSDKPGSVFASGSKRTSPSAQRKPAGGDKDSAPAAGAAPPPAVSEAAPPQRDADGWLVSPPPYQVMRDASMTGQTTSTGTEINGPNCEMKEVQSWFERLYEAGASGRTIELARYRWQPHNMRAVRWARDHFIDAIEAKARKRDAERARIAYEAEQPVRNLTYLRGRQRDAEQRRDKVKEELAKLNAEVEKHAAAVEQCLMQHPHLRTPEVDAA